VTREYARRKSGNSRYSLRAFARSLDVDHSTLSQIVRGRRRVTRRVIRAIGPRLRLTQPEIEASCAVENDLAVLAVIARPSFRPDSRWIATVAGISVDEVNVALQRLLYTGAIEMYEQHQWRIR
jgi:transcriptional regulator with XRE-family HTH domain